MNIMVLKNVVLMMFLLGRVIICGNRTQLNQLVGDNGQNIGALWFYRKDPDMAEEAISQKQYPVTTNWIPLELVNGVDLTHKFALRLDGYSTWVQGKHTMVDSISQLTLSVWVALSTYPSEKGAIFALFNNLIIEIDCFGRMKVTFTANQAQTVLDVQGVVIPRYQWVHVAIGVIPDELVFVYINGKLVFMDALNSVGYQWPDQSEFYIGRHPESDWYFGFDRNVMNGIVDEVTLYDELLSSEEIEEIAKMDRSRENVDLHVPNSRFSSDFNRPRYHVIPEAGWTNEPTGFIYYNRTYHLFNQKNGNGPYWWRINWGHFTSTDLVHWTEQNAALWPTPGADNVGIWSGHTVISDEGIPTTLYTGVNGVKAGVFAAQSNLNGDDPNLISWEKNDSGNPVIQQRPISFPGDDFRDPFVWKDEESNQWKLIIGTGIDTEQGCVGGAFIYKSADLLTWELVERPFFMGDPSSMGGQQVGTFWEMPIVVFINNKVVLAVNRTPVDGLRADVLYWVGTIVDDMFIPDDIMPKTLELLICELSPTLVQDDEGRLVAIGISPDTWIAFQQDWLAHKQLGWANMMSLPKVWTLDENNARIIRAPHPNLQKLRQNEQSFQQLYLLPSQPSYLQNTIKGLQLEVIACFQAGAQTQQLGLVLLRSPDDAEQTIIYYDFVNQQIVVDRSHSSLNPNAVNDITSGPYQLSTNDNLTFHVFLDHSSIEVFINQKDAFSTRVFTTRKESDIFDLHVRGQGAKLVSLNVWEMRSQDDMSHIHDVHVDDMHGLHDVHFDVVNGLHDVHGDVMHGLHDEHISLNSNDVLDVSDFMYTSQLENNTENGVSFIYQDFQNKKFLDSESQKINVGWNSNNSPVQQRVTDVDMQSNNITYVDMYDMHAEHVEHVAHDDLFIAQVKIDDLTQVSSSVGNLNNQSHEIDNFKIEKVDVLIAEI